MATYPVELCLDGREVLVVGGGRVAARRVAGLRDAGARVRVVSPVFVPDLRQREDVEREVGEYHPTAIGSAVLVFACTNDAATNARIAADAAAAGRWCNVADDPAASGFHVPAVLRQSGLTISVGTGGASPGLAARLRDRLGSQLGPEWGILVEELMRNRETVLRDIQDPGLRRRVFATLCEEPSVELLRSRGREAWREWAQQVLKGAGPDSPPTP